MQNTVYMIISFSKRWDKCKMTPYISKGKLWKINQKLNVHCGGREQYKGKEPSLFRLFLNKPNYIITIVGFSLKAKEINKISVS